MVNASANGLFTKAITKAIQTNLATDNSKALGYKTFKILDITFRNQVKCGFVGNPTLVKYDVLVKHKTIEDWKNLSAFEVLVYDDGKMGAMFNGCGNYSVRKNDGRVFLHNIDIHYGSFTKEMADAWLKKVENRINMKR